MQISLLYAWSNMYLIYIRTFSCGILIQRELTASIVIRRSTCIRVKSRVSVVYISISLCLTSIWLRIDNTTKRLSFPLAQILIAILQSQLTQNTECSKIHLSVFPLVYLVSGWQCRAVHLKTSDQVIYIEPGLCSVKLPGNLLLHTFDCVL